MEVVLRAAVKNSKRQRWSNNFLEQLLNKALIRMEAHSLCWLVYKYRMFSWFIHYWKKHLGAKIRQRNMDLPGQYFHLSTVTALKQEDTQRNHCIQQIVSPLKHLQVGDLKDVFGNKTEPYLDWLQQRTLKLVTLVIKRKN